MFYYVAVLSVYRAASGAGDIALVKKYMNIDSGAWKYEATLTKWFLTFVIHSSCSYNYTASSMSSVLRLSSVVGHKVVNI